MTTEELWAAAERVGVRRADGAWHDAMRAEGVSDADMRSLLDKHIVEYGTSTGTLSTLYGDVPREWKVIGPKEIIREKYQPPKRRERERRGRHKV